MCEVPFVHLSLPGDQRNPARGTDTPAAASPGYTGDIDQAAGILEAAENAADRALAELDRAAQERSTASDPSESEAGRQEAAERAEQAEREAVEAQQEVRDELTAAHGDLLPESLRPTY